MASQSESNIIHGLQREIRRYVRRVMIISHVHGDGEFDKKKIKDTIKPATMKIRAPDKHCGPAERAVRTIKERTRCQVHRLPYKQYPQVLL